MTNQNGAGYRNRSRIRRMNQNRDRQAADRQQTNPAEGHPEAGAQNSPGAYPPSEGTALRARGIR